MKSSASCRVKTPAVVPTARTQLAPTALASLRHSSSERPSNKPEDIAGVERVAATRAVDERDRIGAKLHAKCVGNRHDAQFSASDHYASAPMSWKIWACRTGSDSRRISSASSALGTKMSVFGSTTLRGSR